MDLLDPEKDQNRTKEIPDYYELENADQLLAISDPIRYKMILYLREKSMTGAQLARKLNMSRPRAHYHLKILVNTGLVELEEERIINGMIGKFYQAIAHYFSYDNLTEKIKEKNPGDPEAINTYKAISAFAFTVLETSRDNLVNDRHEEDLAEAFQFNFDSNLTFEQFEIIRQELRDVASHLMQMKKENKSPEKTGLQNFRTTIFFTPLPKITIENDENENLILEDELEEKEEKK